MVGELAVSFCDRTVERGLGFLDLWAYPDGTYNLVVEDLAGINEHLELCFPCSFHQLARVLSGRALVIRRDGGILAIDLCGDSICAEFEPADNGRIQRHCIAKEEYRLALETLSAKSAGFLG